MSENGQALTVAILTLLTAVVSAVAAHLAWQRSVANGKAADELRSHLTQQDQHLGEVKTDIDGRLVELILAVQQVAKLEGQAEGRVLEKADEAVRLAEHLLREQADRKEPI